jgi:hypothetical protein
MKAAARSIKRPGLLGLLAAISVAAAVAACLSLLGLARAPETAALGPGQAEAAPAAAESP